MVVKKYKPTSAGSRSKQVQDYSELKTGQNTEELTSRKRKELRTETKGLRRIQVAIPKSVGRNNQGKITSRFRGGGHKRLYKVIDFLRSDKAGIPGKVDFLDYDSSRNCRIALIVFADGEKRYILAPTKLAIGDSVMSGPMSPIKEGNALPLANMPLGSQVHNIEMTPGKGGQMVRSAGLSAQVIAKEKGMVALKLPSGEMRWVLERCYATLGQVGNPEFSNQKLGKAGTLKWRGRRPRNRGVTMNPVDHKHGGGEGRCPVGAASPYTAFGKPHGLKTRKSKKSSTKLIISRRKRK